MQRLTVTGTSLAALGLCLLLTLFTVDSAAAQEAAKAAPASSIPYQGYITDTEGKALPDGPYTFTFTLYDTAEGGTSLWEGTYTQVQVVGGLVQVELGSGETPLALPFDQPYYLSVRLGEEPEMGPRLKLPTAAYSFRARVADEVAPGSITDEHVESISWEKITGIPDEVQAAASEGSLDTKGAGKGGDGGGRQTAGSPCDGCYFWAVRGNSGTIPGSHYIGTSDNKDLIFKTKGKKRMTITKGGEVLLKGDLSMDGDLDVEGILHVTNTTESTATNNGALIVDGGVGIDLRLNVGGDGRFENNLNVDGMTTLNSSLDVNGGTMLNSSLDVDGSTMLNSSLSVMGTTSLNSSLDVDGGTTLNSTLDVDGIATLNEALDVDGASTLNSTLDVDGGATLNSTLDVDGLTTLNDALDVDGGATLNSTLDVDGIATLNNALDVDGLTTLNNTTQSTSTTNGALVVSGGIGVAKTMNVGDDLGVADDGSFGGSVGVGIAAPSNHMLHVRGAGNFEGGHVAFFENTGTSSPDGIGIKVSTSTPSNGNNFVTFFNGSGGRVGRIEGETLSQLRDSWEYEWTTAMAVIDQALIVAEGVATAAQIDFAEAAVMATEGVAKYVHWDAWVDEKEARVGVTYASGNGDYAEYLERLDPSEHLQPGDIVGVFGGKISKSTKGAQQIMAISTAPIVLGNTPEEGREENYEKVAFLGQIPVKVLGPVNEGDYIIPSGLEDGSGLAVAPEMMTADAFAKVVGRAWSTSNDSGLKTVNVAIGLNAGDVATRVHRQERELMALKAALAQRGHEMEALRAEVASLQTVAQDVARLEAALTKLAAASSEAELVAVPNAEVSGSK